MLMLSDHCVAELPRTCCEALVCKCGLVAWLLACGGGAIVKSAWLMVLHVGCVVASELLHLAHETTIAASLLSLLPVSVADVVRSPVAGSASQQGRL